MKKLLKWGAIGLFAIIVLAVIVGGNNSEKGTSSDSSNTNSGTQTKASPMPEKTYKVGEVISTPTTEVTVASVAERTSVGTQFLKENASEGATLVVVRWKYKNISDKPINSFGQPSIKLVDSKGTEYEKDLGKTSTYSTEISLDRKIFSDLNPGITVNDASVFEVSKEAYAQGAWSLSFKVDGKTYRVEL